MSTKRNRTQLKIVTRFAMNQAANGKRNVAEMIFDSVTRTAENRLRRGAYDGRMVRVVQNILRTANFAN